MDKIFERLINEEINLRIPKDVTFQTPLSGGIDSSILAYFLKKIKKYSNFLRCHQRSTKTSKRSKYKYDGD